MKMHALHMTIPVVFFILWLLQSFFPSRRFPEVRGWRWIGLSFLLLWFAVGSLTPLLLPMTWLHQHRLLNGEQLGLVGGVLVGWSAWTFVQYWFHRAVHRFDWMWRLMHQLHHSAQRIDVFTSVYFHPLELGLIVLLNNVMVTFVFGLEPLAASIVGLMGAASVMLIHTNIRTPEWIGYLIYRPEAHLLHHEKGVHSGNFCDFPVWDLVFSTFRMPHGVYQGEVGFDNPVSSRSMPAGVDANASHQKERA